MILNANDFRVNVEPIQKLTKDMTHNERMEFIGMLAVSTDVPIIIVCCYIGELYGFTDDLNQKIEDLKKFYDVTEIRGINGR